MEPSAVLLVGDSITDIEASQTAQATAIGYANRLDKVARLDAVGADLVVTCIGELADSLR
ncbi:hypothetical protein GCM10022248_69530 [Nonomuraea soli]